MHNPESIHRLYGEHHASWEFFRQAYLGGAEWQDSRQLYGYLNEREQQLALRIRQTPLENHCRSVVHTYSGFLWRNPPKRSFGRLEHNRAALALNANADKEGASLNEFMKTAQLWASVFGTVWIVIDKPATPAATKADELREDIRPYLKLYFPSNVLDWAFEESPSGTPVLSYLNVRERTDGQNGGGWLYRIWTGNRVSIWHAEGRSAPVLQSQQPNPIGTVPALVHYNTKPILRGIALSDLQDIAPMQRSAYNDMSELMQMIRGSNHKTLVKNRNDDASTGAGGVIIMDEDTPSDKKPYLLQADAEALKGLLDTIAMKTEMINRMAHLTPVRSYHTTALSGVALETEFQILNTLLAEKAAQLELTETRLFRLFCLWEGIDYQHAKVQVIYPRHFELRDRRADLDFLSKARDLADSIGSPTLTLELNRQLARVMLERDDVLERVEAELR